MFSDNSYAVNKLWTQRLLIQQLTWAPQFDWGIGRNAMLIKIIRSSSFRHPDD